MWSKSELKLQWFDKLLMTVVGVGAEKVMLSPGLVWTSLLSLKLKL